MMAFCACAKKENPTPGNNNGSTNKPVYRSIEITCKHFYPDSSGKAQDSLLSNVWLQFFDSEEAQFIGQNPVFEVRSDSLGFAQFQQVETDAIWVSGLAHTDTLQLQAKDVYNTETPNAIAKEELRFFSP